MIDLNAGSANCSEWRAKPPWPKDRQLDCLRDLYTSFRLILRGLGGNNGQGATAVSSHPPLREKNAHGMVAADEKLQYELGTCIDVKMSFDQSLLVTKHNFAW